ncbi:hypothetical protein LWI29_008999 [Acer saccharum]|uniref:Uncharacterized protein n=1 Tax=Acer saccharum TaxID=4024 RepID=A0AA39SUL1_ACESA|nr:hypothetical protein LWI29_008999 [Acer saccharum]
MSLVKKLPPKSILEASPQIIVKPKDNSQKPDLRTECEDENAIGNLPLPSVNNDTSKGLVTRQSNFGSYSGNAPPTPVTRNIKPSPWCFPPPRSFMAPFYGSCGPVSLTPVGGDFLSTAYGVPASHQQGIGILAGNPPLGQTYFPPYGMPVMNPSISSSAVEQRSLFPGTRPKDNHLSASKESEVQGSTASSPAAERAKGDALPLFPMEPTVQASDQNAQTNEQQSQVIKVVPHNPRLATESAARIFQSIQEEVYVDLVEKVARDVRDQPAIPPRRSPIPIKVLVAPSPPPFATKLVPTTQQFRLRPEVPIWDGDNGIWDGNNGIQDTFIADEQERVVDANDSYSSDGDEIHESQEVFSSHM